jgi:hypothetical protein
MTVHYLFQAIIFREKSVSINNIVCFKQHCLGNACPVSDDISLSGRRQQISLSQMTTPPLSDWPRPRFLCLRWQYVRNTSVSDDNSHRFLSLILTLEERAGAIGQPREDCTGGVYCCLRQKRFPFRASLSRVLCAWASCLHGPLLVGSPRLSFEAEEPGNQGRTACFNVRVLYVPVRDPTVRAEFPPPQRALQKELALTPGITRRG